MPGIVPGNLTKPRFHTPVSIGVSTFVELSNGPTAFHRNDIWWMFRPPGMTRNQQRVFRSIWIFLAKREFSTQTSVHLFSDTIYSDKQDSHEVPNASAKHILECSKSINCNGNIGMQKCFLKVLEGSIHCLGGQLWHPFHGLRVRRKKAKIANAIPHK